MPQGADIDNSCLLRLLEQLKKVIGEVEVAKMVDGVGHLNAQLTYGFFIQHQPSIIDQDVHCFEIGLNTTSITFTFFTNSSIDSLFDKSSLKYFKVPPSFWVMSLAAF